MSPRRLPGLHEGLLPGQPDSGLGEGCSKEKRRRRGEEDGALAPAAARHLPRGLVLPAPSARGTGVGDGGARGPRVLSAAEDGQKESVLTAGGRGGLLRRRGAAAAGSAAHVSTTRMSGMDLGLGGLAILTPPRFSAVAQVWVLKLLWLICFSIRCSNRSCISRFSASR